MFKFHLYYIEDGFAPAFNGFYIVNHKKFWLAYIKILIGINNVSKQTSAKTILPALLGKLPERFLDVYVNSIHIAIVSCVRCQDWFRMFKKALLVGIE